MWIDGKQHGHRGQRCSGRRQRGPPTDTRKTVHQGDANQCQQHCEIEPKGTGICESAADGNRVKIYAIGVGSGADMELMDDIAEYGQTSEGYWANGDWETIQSDLEDIFQRIGGRRPVQLIE